MTMIWSHLILIINVAEVLILTTEAFQLCCVREFHRGIGVSGFTGVKGTHSHIINSHRESSRTKLLLGAFDGQDKDDDEEDGDYIDSNSLGDWKSFRRNLVQTDNQRPQNNSDDDENLIQSDRGIDQTSLKIEKDIKKNKNLEVLRQQNENLANEYMNDVWAHEAPEIDVGGLVVRLPLEVEIYRSQKLHNVGEELSRLLEKGEDSDDNQQQSKTSLFAQTVSWYRQAQNLIEYHMSSVVSKANEKGEIFSSMEPLTGELLELYIDNQETWQEVCLVIQKNDKKGSATTLVLNRPMAFSLSESVGRRVLYGSKNALFADTRSSTTQNGELIKFLSAFENQCAVYLGGPQNLDQPAIMIHPFGDLEGAQEISPGSGIYQGGISAASQGVLSGKYKPLDFRFFIGSHVYKDGTLDAAIYSNKYQPVVCARTIALKQCIQLPKPLWHEVMELCGGESREISILEMMKRADLLQADD